MDQISKEVIIFDDCPFALQTASYNRSSKKVKFERVKVHYKNINDQIERGYLCV